MIEPKSAAVRPRVFAGSARGSVLLEDLVSDWLSSRNPSQIELFGRPASGVTTALQHLADRFGSESDLCFSELNRDAIEFEKRPAALITCRRMNPRLPPVSVKCTLAGWERDEWIEYLLALHKPQCASVMKRMQHGSDIGGLGGNPNIVRQVLDELAADEQLPDVPSTLRRIVEKQFPAASQRHATGRRIFLRLFRRNDQGDTAKKICTPDMSHPQLCLLYVPAILRMLAAESVWAELSDRQQGDQLPKDWTRDLIEAVAPLVGQSPLVQDRLRRWVRRFDREGHPLAISLLHLAGVDWEWPPAKFIDLARSRLNLAGAILDGADCTRVSLARTNLKDASFVKAKLTGVDLRHAHAANATFVEAELQQTKLADFVGVKAQFHAANLSGACGERADFNHADLSRCNLHEVRLVDCRFHFANLTGANLHSARLERCSFLNSVLDQADFRQANLSESIFCESDLTVADFRLAIFRGANLAGCHLEGMDLPRCDFEGADLKGAACTGSTMPRANFSKANLQFARLAEIDWEFANLRKADLTGATFHMGSSRSGLVGSSIPLEGSRTGFYTDEWNAQDFKSPEEIRSANLRGADLRGACVDRVDFYLVDLRDAIYDMDQAAQFRRTGAILETRIC